MNEGCWARGAVRRAIDASKTKEEDMTGSQSSEITETIRSTQTDVRKVLAEHASKHGVELDDHDPAIATTISGAYRLSIVNIGLAGVDKATLADLLDGVDLLFWYLELEDPGFGIPSGFYKVRVEGRRGVAHLIDANGDVCGRGKLALDLVAVPDGGGDIEFPGLGWDTSMGPTEVCGSLFIILNGTYHCVEICIPKPEVVPG